MRGRMETDSYSGGRSRIQILPILLIFILISISTRAQSNSDSIISNLPRGVSPKDSQLYQPTSDNSFKCHTTSQTIPFSSVNDDYCDCQDGSDEPGTSACSDKINKNQTGNKPKGFWCENQGHEETWILNSRVGDGICDCCDTSDESQNPSSNCQNTCSSDGKAYRKAQTELLNKRRSGSKIRDSYIKEALKSSVGGEKEVDRLEIELEVARMNEVRLKGVLERKEGEERRGREEVGRGAFHTELVRFQKSLKHQSQMIHYLNQELRTLTSLMDDLAIGYNPNYQDMAVKGAVVEYRKWRKTKENWFDDEADSSTEEEVEVKDEMSIKDEINLPNRKLESFEKGFEDEEFGRLKVKELERKNLLDWILGSEIYGAGGDGSVKNKGASKGLKNDEGGILFRIHEYLPDQIVPYFEAFVDTLLDLLMKANVITDFKRRSPTDDFGLDFGSEAGISASQARENLLHNSAKITNLTSALNTARQSSNTQPTKYGRSLEFKTLDQKCLTKDMGEYTYEFCFFGGTKQIPNKGGQTVGLGKYSKFDKSGKSSEESDEYFESMIYDKGQKCWNGPERSTLVDLVCDTTNALLDVFEAEKCIYSMKVSTPAVCWPLTEESEKPTQDGKEGSIGHEEL